MVVWPEGQMRPGEYGTSYVEVLPSLPSVASLKSWLPQAKQVEAGKCQKVVVSLPSVKM